MYRLRYTPGPEVGQTIHEGNAAGRIPAPAKPPNVTGRDAQFARKLRPRRRNSLARRRELVREATVF